MHLPTAERVAQMISMVLQAKGATPGDVSGALESIETMILVVGALEAVWSAHEVPVWHEKTAADPGVAGDPDSPPTRRNRRAAIEAGNAEQAFAVATAHLAATRQNTQAASEHGDYQPKPG